MFGCFSVLFGVGESFWVLEVFWGVENLPGCFIVFAGVFHCYWCWKVLKVLLGNLGADGGLECFGCFSILFVVGESF